MGKEKTKLNLYRILKILVFLAAFPLYAYLVQVVGKSTDGFLLALVMMLVVGFVQVIMYIIAKKKYRARAFVSALVAFALVLGFVMLYNVKGEAAVEKAKTDYHVGQSKVMVITEKQDGMVDFLKTIKPENDISTIGEKGVFFYVADKDEYSGIETKAKEKGITVTKKVISGPTVKIDDFNVMVHGESTAQARLEEFVEIYNIREKGKVYGTGENADGSEYKYVKEDDTYVSENGMLADGYVFGYKKAMEILTTYNNTQAYYAAMGLDADKVLEDELTRLETSSSSKWKAYQATAAYQAAYGEKGTARKYYIDEVRLNQILSVLGKNLDKPVDGLTTILSMMGDLAAYASYLDLVKEGLTIDQIMTILQGFGLGSEEGVKTYILDLLNSDLTKEAIIEVVNQSENCAGTEAKTFVLDLLKDEDKDKPEIITAMNDWVAPSLEKADVMGLLANFSFYQDPSLKPIYEFIEDETLREYGYAVYYGKTHGATVGAVLIGDQIGEITMDSKGVPASMGWTQKEIDQLSADLAYEGRIYTYASLRHYGYLFMGFIPLLYLFAYHFAEKERKVFNAMINKEVA